jgi:large conductance mechanosensitive channel
MYVFNTLVSLNIKKTGTMSMMKEFKAFAMRGNVVDMAVGIVIGGAFGKIIASFVSDVLMPPIGLLLGGVSFTDLKLTLQDAVLDADGIETVAAVSINYGSFIQTMVDFIIIAFAIFMVVKAMNSMKKKEEAAPAAPPAPTKEEVLLGEIRDLLKK